MGTFALGTDFQNNGNLIMSEENFLRVLPHRRGASWGDTAIDIGVLRLAGGVDVEAAPDGAPGGRCPRT